MFVGGNSDEASLEQVELGATANLSLQEFELGVTRRVLSICRYVIEPWSSTLTPSVPDVQGY